MGGNIVFFDWTDAAVSHPFFDLHSLQWEANAAERRDLRAAYMAVWEEDISPSLLHEAGAVADVLLPLYHAVSYQHIHAGIEPAARVEIAHPAEFLVTLLQQVEAYLQKETEAA